MDVISVLEELEDLIDEAMSVPLTTKKMIDAKVVMEMIMRVKLGLPEEVEKAKRITKEKQRILLDAQAEADSTIKEAKNTINKLMSKLVEKHEITKEANKRAEEILLNAQKTAKSIRANSMEYAVEILDKTEEAIKGALDTLQKNKKEVRG